MERVANQIKLIFVITRAKRERERMMHNYPSVSSPEARQILLFFFCFSKIVGFILKDEQQINF